jgi:hypothetical protein
MATTADVTLHGHGRVDRAVMNGHHHGVSMIGMRIRRSGMYSLGAARRRHLMRVSQPLLMNGRLGAARRRHLVRDTQTLPRKFMRSRQQGRCWSQN